MLQNSFLQSDFLQTSHHLSYFLKLKMIYVSQENAVLHKVIPQALIVRVECSGTEQTVGQISIKVATIGKNCLNLHELL